MKSPDKKAVRLAADAFDSQYATKRKEIQEDHETQRGLRMGYECTKRAEAENALQDLMSSQTCIATLAPLYVELSGVYGRVPPSFRIYPKPLLCACQLWKWAYRKIEVYLINLDGTWAFTTYNHDLIMDGGRCAYSTPVALNQGALVPCIVAALKLHDRGGSALCSTDPLWCGDVWKELED